MSDDATFPPVAPPAGPAPRRQGPPVRLIAIVGVVAVVAIFILQNRERTELDFLVFEMRVRVWIALTAAVAVGVVLDRLFLGWWRKRRTAREAATT